jgi:hypothetical protein
LIYFLLTWAVLTGISSFVAYFYYRSYSPMQPNVETGQIYPLRMKQPFDVYLTEFQAFWVQYGMIVAVIPGFVAGYLNTRWKIIQNTPYDGLLGKKKY